MSMLAELHEVLDITKQVRQVYDDVKLREHYQDQWEMSQLLFRNARTAVRNNEIEKCDYYRDCLRISMKISRILRQELNARGIYDV